ENEQAAGDESQRCPPLTGEQDDDEFDEEHRSGGESDPGEPVGRQDRQATETDEQCHGGPEEKGEGNRTARRGGNGEEHRRGKADEGEPVRGKKLSHPSAVRSTAYENGDIVSQSAGRRAIKAFFGACKSREPTPPGSRLACLPKSRRHFAK